MDENNVTIKFNSSKFIIITLLLLSFDTLGD